MDKVTSNTLSTGNNHVGKSILMNVGKYLEDPILSGLYFGAGIGALLGSWFIVLSAKNKIPAIEKLKIIGVTSIIYAVTGGLIGFYNKRKQ
jgi:hypothetical protein